MSKVELAQKLKDLDSNNPQERIAAIAYELNPLIIKKAIATFCVSDVGDYWIEFLKDLPQKFVDSAIKRLQKIYKTDYNTPIYGLLLNTSLSKEQFDTIIKFCSKSKYNYHIEGLMKKNPITDDVVLAHFLRTYSSKEFLEKDAVEHIPVIDNTILFLLKYWLKNYQDKAYFRYQLHSIIRIFPKWSEKADGQSNFVAMTHLMCLLKMSNREEDGLFSCKNLQIL